MNLGCFNPEISNFFGLNQEGSGLKRQGKKNLNSQGNHHNLLLMRHLILFIILKRCNIRVK